METSFIILIIIGFLVLFLLLVESVISSGLSQAGTEIDTANDDLETIEAQNTANSTSISTVSTKTQNMSATPGNTNFTGTMTVTGELTVGNINVVDEIDNLNATIDTGAFEVTDLTVGDLTAGNVTATELSVTTFIPQKGILLAPCAYIFDSKEGEPTTNKDYRIVGLWMIVGTMGNFTYSGDIHGVYLNPGFSIRLFKDVNYVNLFCAFINTFSSPCVYTANGTTFQNSTVKSCIVYYNGKVFNPIAFGTSPTGGTAPIPSEYLTPPTSNSPAISTITTSFY